MLNFHWTALVLLFGVLCGCSGNKRGDVEGTVTLDGKPVENGVLAFLPMEATTGPSSGAGIQNGKYTIPADKGPMPGTYRVEINARRKTGKKIHVDEMPTAIVGSPQGSGDVEETEEAIPAIYNKDSTLRVEVKTGKNTLNFELTSKPK